MPLQQPGVLRQVVLRIEQRIWIHSVFGADRQIVRNRIDVACYTLPCVLKVLRRPEQATFLDQSIIMKECGEVPDTQPDGPVIEPNDFRDQC